MYGGGKPHRVSDVIDFSFSEKLEPVDVLILGGKKIGTTEGVYSGTGSITLLLREQIKLARLMKEVAKARRIKLGAVMFSVQGSFRATLSSDLVRFSASGCRVTERTLEGAADANAIQVPLPLNIQQLRIDGCSLGEIPR
jgi:hypothetical protein